MSKYSLAGVVVGAASLMAVFVAVAVNSFTTPSKSPAPRVDDFRSKGLTIEIVCRQRSISGLVCAVAK